MKKNKIIIFTFCLIISFCATTIANAQWVIADVEAMAVAAGLSIDNPQTIINTLTLWLLGLVVAVGIVAIIWGGIKYTSSSGDTEQATDAKKTVKYALLGIIVAGVAWALINVVVGTILAP